MAAIARLTNNTDETDVASFISKDNIFSIPFFQRPYKWKPERVIQLQNDILNLVDESSDFHFLGAVIVHGRRTNPSEPDIFDVIDGQQRLTTIYLLLCAVVKILSSKNEYDEASAIFQKYIAINRNLANLSNARIHSCKEDRAQMNAIIRDVISDENLSKKLGSFKFKQLPISANSKDKGTLRNNFNSMLRFLKFEMEEGGIDRVRDIYSCLLNKVTIVQIDIKDPASGPAIFDSLNSRQEPMTIGDLVRNGIFSKVAELEPDEIEIIDRDNWQPFYKGFDEAGRNHFDSFFFPYGLIENSNLKKSDIYSHLQKKWTATPNPVDIISDLIEYQDPFMDIVCGTNRTNHPLALNRQFLNLHGLGIPSSTLPFLMRLSRECKLGNLDHDEGTRILAVVESFLVRRALCGIEPTGLHAVFKRLWQDLGTDVTQQNVIKRIRNHKTVSWPNDDELSKNVKTRSLYGAAITPYFLIEFDKSLGGDLPSDKPWIEHVLPKTPSTDWWTNFDEQQHEELVDTLANLLPLSPKMNGHLGNISYSDKKKSYAEDSMFKAARDFPKIFDQWGPDEIATRANQLSDWAISRWPAFML